MNLKNIVLREINHTDDTYIINSFTFYTGKPQNMLFRNTYINNKNIKSKKMATYLGEGYGIRERHSESFENTDDFLFLIVMGTWFLLINYSLNCTYIL